MPIRTDLVISIGEILDCLPPGKHYKKKRYTSSFNASLDDVENEENVWPPLADRLSRVRCDSSPRIMKSKENGTSESDIDQHAVPNRRTRYSADGRKHSVETVEEDEDNEVSFHPDSLTNGESTAAGSKTKSKRKSSAEKFLEDNSNYFQLEVLASKTRSSKVFDEATSTSNDDNAGGKDFHNSFLDFLKSKGVEDGEDSDSSPPNPRSRHKSGPASHHRNGGDYSHSPARSDSTDSTPARSLRGGDATESPRPLRSRGHNSKPRSMSRLRSRSRDFSLSESEPDTDKLSLPRKEACSLESSDDESSNSSSNQEKRTRSSSSNNHLDSPSKRSRRSELDKLLEAVDTSFHYESAAAERKRLGDSNGDLGPLEIDVSDSNVGSDDENSNTEVGAKSAAAPETDNKDINEKDEDEPAVAKTTSKKGKGRKRKLTEVEGAKEKVAKRRVNRGNLLKTMSPSNESSACLNSEIDEDTSSKAIEEIAEKLGQADGSPINLVDLYLSFEGPPTREAWFQTYSRQDRGDDVVYYPDSKIFPFALPYELPLSTFMPQRLEIKSELKGGLKGEKKDMDVPQATGKKSRSVKVSESESTDSENNNRRTKCKFGLKTEHLQDLQPRVSPRCHASTKDDSGFPFIGGFDETSNDSLSSAFTKNLKQESSEDYINIASSIDEFIRDATGLKVNTDVKGDPASMPNVPTRSRISSDLLLKNMKPKKKKKGASNEVVMDNFVTDNVDSLLLDCLEEELPTVPLELDESDVVSLVSTYQLCKSMNVCNSRWLRPSRPSIPGGGGEHPSTSTNTASLAKHHLFGSKPKRLVIYKEDLPGFKYDNDIESEKLPISKRMAKKVVESVKKEPEEDESSESTTEPTSSNKSSKEDRTPKKGPKGTSGKSPKGTGGKSPKVKKVFVAKKTKINVEKADDDNDDDENENVEVGDNCSEAESSASTAIRKKRLSKTGLPLKKKKLKEKKSTTGLKKEKGTIKKKVKKENSKDESSPSPPTSAKKSPKIKAIKSPKVKKEGGGTPKSGGKDNGSPAAASSSKDSSPSLKQPSAGKDKVKKKLGLKKRMRNSSESAKQSARGSGSKRSTTLKSINYNYSEQESDSESLLEAKVPYRSPHIKAIIAKQQAEMASKRQKNKAKK